MKEVKVNQFKIGDGKNLVFILGPCVIESESHCLKLAEQCARLTESKQVSFIFKASYDKANRSSHESYRGPGLKEGLKILKKVKETFLVPILTDLHSQEEVESVSEVVDVIQIPAFLCRQTDLLMAAAKTKKVINVKKGQFLAPWDMKNVVAKLEAAGTDQILITERGASFGYNTLVSDFRSLPIMREMGYPVIYDATHSVQQPGGRGNCSGGESQFVPALARAAAAVGCDGIFMEVHETPEKALSDGPNALALDQLSQLMDEIIEINQIVKNEKVKI